VNGANVTNHQPADAPTDETSLPERMSDCRSPVEQALWRALKTARDERDEARRWFCQRAEWIEGGDGTQTAKELGWDCFKEDGK
jgi:hypothetical protein